ncbi:hypothetical protein LV178_14375, partial [Burkholderia mallei]|nr:hypothetical protein [Burkholderia mallei]
RAPAPGLAEPANVEDCTMWLRLRLRLRRGLARPRWPPVRHVPPMSRRATRKRKGDVHLLDIAFFDRARRFVE